MANITYMNLVSIIIPVYNSAKFLRKCLESIKSQTYTDFEVIMVNDGSTDESECICNQYTSIDRRFFLYSKNNEGVSHARNFGLKKAHGRWVMFVDSDDWLEPTTLEDCIKSSKGVEYVRFNFKSIFADNRFSIDKRLNSTWNLLEYFSRVYSRQTILGVCGGFYLRSIFEENHITFNPRYSMGEDWLVLIEYLRHVNSIKILEKPYYNYNKINEFSTTSSLNVKKVMELIEVASLVCFNEGNLSLVNALDVATLKSNVCGTCLSSLILKRVAFSEIKTVLSYMKEYNVFPRCNEILRSTLSIKYKLVLISCTLIKSFS